MRGFVIAACLVGLAPLNVAKADDGYSESLEPGTVKNPPTENRINLRLGGSTTDSTGRPTICVDVRIWRGLGVES